jgi:hypothetical protein
VRGTGAVLVAMLMAALVGVPAAASAADPRAGRPVMANLGEAAALAAARSAGRPVEATALRTETRRVTANPEGTVTLEQHALPVRVRRESGWVPVDTTLHRNRDGSVTPGATSLGLILSGGGSGPLVRIARDGKELALGWPGSLPAPLLSGDTATYPEVLPGVDLVLRAGVDGLSELLVVKDARAAANPALSRIRFSTRVTAVSLRPTGDGGLVASDTTGQPVFQAPRPHMWDSARATNGAAAARRWPMPVRLAANELAVLPQRAVLTAPGTRFPLFIDPSWSGARLAWTQVWSNYPTTSFYNGANLGSSENVARVGYDATDRKLTRSFFRLDTNGVRGKHILKATMQTFEEWSRSCSARPVEMWATNPISSATTWNNQPSWAFRMDSKSIAKGYSSSCPAGGVEFNATAQVVNAARNGWSNITVGLRAPSSYESARDALTWKKFRNNPTLTVVYNTVPKVPTNLTTDGSSACVTGSNRPVIGTATPTLRATVSDADNSVKAHFQWFRTGGSTAVGEYLSPSVAGVRPTVVAVRIPSGAFSNGATVSWRVRAYDGTDYSAWSPWCEFTVDTSRPPMPAASSPGFPDGAEGNAVMGTAMPVTFTANGGTDVVYYEYGVNVDASALATRATPSVASGPVSVSVVPDRFVNWLHVRGVDRAGNKSDVATFVFSAATPSGPVGDWRLDEAEGATEAVDSSSNAFHATLAGAASWVDGVNGNALHLDGTSGSAGTAGPVVRTDQSFSVSAWVRVSTAASYGATVVSEDGNRNGGFSLQYWGPTRQWRFAMPTADTDNAGANAALSAAPAQVGAWTHLIGVYDASAAQVRLYVNGVLAGTAPRPGSWNAAGALQLGRAKAGGSYGGYWPGDVDAVQVHQRVLLPGEIQQVPRVGGGWRLDEASGVTASDVTGAHPGTLSGGASWTAGRTGNAVALDGSTGQISTAGPAVRTDGSYTVAAWVRLAATGRAAVAVSQDGSAVSGFTLGYSWDVADGRGSWSFGGATSDAAGAGTREAVDVFDPPQTGVWTHLAGVYDAKERTLRLYVNGQFVDETSHTSAWNAGGKAYIGRGRMPGAATPAYWPGAVDDVWLYSGVLSDQEIWDEYGPVADPTPPRVSFWPTSTPEYRIYHDARPVELGLRFSSSAAGSVTALRFMKASGDTGPHTLSLWSATGSLLAQVTTDAETDAGWQQVSLPDPVPIEPDQVHVVSYHSSTGTYAAANRFFTTNGALTSGPLTAPADNNGVYVYGPTALPTETYEGSNYLADVVFS